MEAKLKHNEDIEEIIHKIENRIEELEEFYENLIPYSQLEYTYDKEDFSNEDERPDNHFLISMEFDRYYLDKIIEEVINDKEQLQGFSENKYFSDIELVSSLLIKQYKVIYDKIEESYGVDKDCKVYSEYNDIDYDKQLLLILAGPQEKSDELDYEEFVELYDEDLTVLIKNEIPNSIIGEEIPDKGLPVSSTQLLTIISVLSFEDIHIKNAGADKSSNFDGNKFRAYGATVELELKVKFVFYLHESYYDENEELKIYYKPNKRLSNGMLELKGEGIISTTISINGIIENDILENIEELEIEEISLIEELIN